MFITNCKAQDTIKKNNFNNGLANYKLKNYKQSLIDFDKAINADSNYAEAYYQRGLVKEKLQMNCKEAYTDYTKAICLGINKAEVYCARAFSMNCDAYIDSKYNKYIFDDIEKALYLDSTYAGAYATRAIFRIYRYYDSTKVFSDPIPDSIYKMAINDYDKAIKYDTINTYYYVNRGLYKIHIKEIENACEDFKKAAEMGGDYEKQYYDIYCIKQNGIKENK